MRLIQVFASVTGIFLSANFLLFAVDAAAQEKPSLSISASDTRESHSAETGSATARSSSPGPIQDNSFLIEEAYNQDDGVVQHINTYTRYATSKDWVYSFTQEWPGLSNVRNQFSYSLFAQSTGAYPGSGAGIGDAMLNYRYQLIGNGETRFAFAPRLSVLIPSGNSRVGRGFGGWGVQAGLPVSLELNRHWVTHWNVGATIVPRAQDAQGDRSLSTGYSLGQSTVWLVHSRVNVMMETIWNGSETVVGPQRTQRVHSLFLSPGVRWSHNLSHRLQIVPGIGVPVGVGPSAGEKGIFLYLSFEHPFRSPNTEKTESLAVNR